MISKNGVCYDITHTPYTYSWRGITYHFSTEKHRAKFIENVRAKEMWLNDSLSRRFRCTVDLPLLADVQLYTQIETRGFYLVTDDAAEYFNPASIYVSADLRPIGVIDGIQIR